MLTEKINIYLCIFAALKKLICEPQLSPSLLLSFFLLLLPATLFPLALFMQPCADGAGLLSGEPADRAAFPLLTRLMHQPVVFVLKVQKGNPTPLHPYTHPPTVPPSHCRSLTKRAREREQPEPKQNLARAHVGDNPHRTHNKPRTADGMQRGQ